MTSSNAITRRFSKTPTGGVARATVDPTGSGGALPGFGDQRNFELFVEAGFSPVEAVQIMTLNGAKILGHSDRLGSVTAGKLADLVVIDRDYLNCPEPQIKDIQPVMTILNGRIVSRAK